MPKPRILQIITHLALGGAERVAFTLMRGLRDEFEFALYAANGVDPGDVGQSMQRELQDLGIPLYVGTRLPIKFGGLLLAGIKAARAVRDFRPDIIHPHTEIPEASYATMVALRPRLGRIPLVRTIHNTIYWDPWRRLGIWCERHMPRPGIACVSEGAVKAYQELRSAAGMPPPPRPPVIIFNGVHVTVPERRWDRPPGETIRLLFAGRFEDQKGADLLPEIIAGVRPPAGRRCELSIYGSGAHEAALRALAGSPPPGWQINLSGPIPNLTQRMAEYDLLLMPSRYEGLSLIAIESLLLGLPIVATRAPGLREGFPEDYPWLAEPGDAGRYAGLLQRVLDDPASWPGVARQGQDFARTHFDMSVMCAGYRQLYGQALADRADG